MNLSPNNPATRSLDDAWHKICALLMLQLGLTELTIERDTVIHWACGSDMALVVREQIAGLKITLINAAKGTELESHGRRIH